MKEIIVKVPDNTKVIHTLIIVSDNDNYEILSKTNANIDDLNIDYSDYEEEKDE